MRGVDPAESGADWTVFAYECPCGHRGIVRELSASDVFRCVKCGREFQRVQGFTFKEKP